MVVKMDRVTDGIHAMLQKEKMSNEAKKIREVYEITPNADWVNTEFGYYSLDEWKSQGQLDGETHSWEYTDYMKEKFMLEETGQFSFHGAGWTTADFYPPFEEKILEDRGDKEIVQDEAGRGVLFFKHSRDGYMPEYVTHPVKDMETWKKSCKWRMDAETQERYIDLEKRVPEAIAAAKRGEMIVQRFCGGYMYLRSLMGPEELLYMFYDDPELIHECMQTWLELSDAVAAYHQQFVTFDEVFFGEDITYNMGPLISPSMIQEFLFPYYTKLIENIKKRQLDQERKLYIQLDSDGYLESVIPLYKTIGFNVFSPFEVASGSDVVKVGEHFPDIVIKGGIDKRKFSESREQLAEYLDEILPVMKKRGGYVPMCDHGVPPEANIDNYIYYRKRCYDMCKS